MSLTHPSDTASPWMQHALGLAARALFIATPNPHVGCVIVAADGVTVLGEGHTQRVGGPHAEVMAMRDAQARGHDVRGATAYVTLEPCSHHGRTGPCCDALIQAGIGRVVAALQDPNPLVAGQGLARLQAAGVSVELGDGATAARELLIGFLSRMIRQRPWVRMKTALSLDGATALHNGVSQWITGAEARADGHRWRARASALLTGVGTVLADNPQLNVRGVDTPRQPDVVIVDSTLRTPPDAAIFRADRACYIYTCKPDPLRSQALQAAGATIIEMPDAQQPSRVDLAAMLHDLARRGVNELHVEAGAVLQGALLRAGLVDEVLAYVAPRLLGSGARGMALWGPLDTLEEGAALHFRQVERIGEDLRILARVAGSDRF